ncbi:MAG: hypothetical protein H6701_14655, partial [Myxococcales bacterium]|nr:hypothetical protein [Myxococcales bacterium]
GLPTWSAPSDGRRDIFVLPAGDTPLVAAPRKDLVATFSSAIDQDWLTDYKWRAQSIMRWAGAQKALGLPIGEAAPVLAVKGGGEPPWL